MTKPEKDFQIIVNGTQKTVHDDTLSYTQVVDIAFPGHPNNPDVTFDVTFSKAASKPHEGTLALGGSVTVKQHGTTFDVIQATRS